MSLTSSKKCSYMISMPILGDDVVRMFPSDMVGWDNIGAKGVRLGQLVPGELVSD